MRSAGSARTAKFRRLSSLIGLAMLAVGTIACGPENDANMLRPKGKQAKQINDLLFWPVVIAIVIGIGVAGLVLYAAIKFRHKGDDTVPKQVHGNRAVELGATIGSALILAVLAVPSYALVQDLAETPRGALNVEAVGKQWWWQFRYPTDNKPVVGEYSLVTANELVIPKGRDVRLNVRACDGVGASKSGIADTSCNVIHSFWVPALNGKVDAVPGRDNKLTLTAPLDYGPHEYAGYDNAAVYPGICAEYCGLSHANMRFKVIALDPEDYEDWYSKLSEPLEALPVDEENNTSGLAGDLLKKFSCVNCHSFNPTQTLHGPNLAHFASRETFASGKWDITPENVRKWVQDATSMIPMQSEGCAESSFGFTGTYAPGTEVSGERCVGMPSYKEEQGDIPAMTDAEASVIADYLLSLK